jgi:hypothetical protein
MNIFILDENPSIAAQLHCNKHVVKMITETVQMLSTCWKVLDNSQNENPILYKITHVNHPCNVWLRNSSANVKWTLELLESLIAEYDFRYNKPDKFQNARTIHKYCSEHLLDIVHLFPKNDLTPFAQALPDQYKNSNAVIAYQSYYKGDKAEIATWTSRNIPEFMK